MGLNTQFQKLKNITKIGRDNSYDFEVENVHRIIAKHPKSKDAFYTSNCSHPDIVEFITAKQQSDRLTKFNMSVNCTDEFMNKIIKVENLKETGVSKEEIEKADEWNLRFPDTTFEKYDQEWDGFLSHWEGKGYPVVIHRTISASWLWDLIMRSTYTRNEPGVVFLDRANFWNPLNYKETIQATNPCSEQVLAPAGICNLGSINLTQFVNKERTGFDLGKIEKYITYLVRFLDNVNSISKTPLPEYDYSMRNKRRIGCGILGWASALYMMKIRFSSEKASVLRDEVMGVIARAAYMASIDLAKEKGMFSECVPHLHVENAFVKKLNLPDEYMENMLKYGIRNSSLLSIQPTGNCVTKDHVVKTKIGDFTIGELIDRAGIKDKSSLSDGDIIKLPEVISLDTFEGDDSFDTIYVNGVKEVSAIRLETGTILKQTSNHRYLVKINEEYADWVEAKDIQPGMKIISMV